MPKKERFRVLRSDGKPIHLIAKRGHLMVCARGCCCGQTERGHAPVPIDFYKQEYKRRKLRNRIHLSMNGCLGPCPMSNVVLLFFDGKPTWFQSINHPAQIVAIYDYIEKMLEADQHLPPPAELTDYVFNYYSWTSERAERGSLPVLAESESSVERAAVADGILFLTHADTDLLTLHHALERLPERFPSVRGVSLSKVASAEHMKMLLTEHLPDARIIVVRILGGAASVPGLRRLIKKARSQGRQLILVSGAGQPDPDLTANSTVDPAICHDAAAYLQAGGGANFTSLLCFLSDHFLMSGFGYEPPQHQPLHGIYHPDLPTPATITDWLTRRDPARPTVGILFYRSHWMSGNLDFIDELVRAIEARDGNALPVFTTSLKDLAPQPNPLSHNPEGSAPAAFEFFRRDGQPLIDALITTMAFAMGDVNPDGPTPASWSVTTLGQLDVPVLQAICASTARWQWEASPRGLNPLDTAMNVALPEFDGRVIAVPISFKEAVLPAKDGTANDARILCGRTRAEVNRHRSAVDVMHYAVDPERVDRLTRLALRFAVLRRKPNAEKRVAFILTNSPGKAARIGNAVGLDAPASLMKVLAAMQEAGYHIDNLPADGDSLIHSLIDRCSYDETLLTGSQLANAAGRVPVETYQRWFDELPEVQSRQMTDQWGPPPGNAYVHDDYLALAGLNLGNVFLALQPPRGYGMDPNAIYHRPDLPPTHNYYALYRWLRDVWHADAIVHFGKHGTLEWLPGKSVGMSAQCYPDTFLADLPLFYPFILNDPGEGAQAKRRGHAVIIDHLTPPLTTADGYGVLAELMQLVDEFYQVELLDPSKMPLLQQQIWDLIKEGHLEEDLKFLMQQNHGDHTHEWDEGVTDEGTPMSLASMRGQDVSHLVQELDGYLCELAGAQIRDGLHIFGQAPEGDQLVNLLQALTRAPNLEVPSLRATTAEIFGLRLESLLEEPGRRLEQPPEALQRLAARPMVTHADALETIDELGQHLLALLQRRDFNVSTIDAVIHETLGTASARVLHVLRFVCERLAPALKQTGDEITNLLSGLAGRYVPAGPSGAPTRGMAHVLPTGRNFYTVDPRALPSAAAWHIGQELAREVVARFRRETGSYPESVGISVWGTSAMRTHGDDVAEIMALLGVRPRWQRENRRIVGIDVIPLTELGRPRIDVTIRISGFFRDAFPHLIALLDEAVTTVAGLDEPLEQNFVRKHYLAEVADQIAAGVVKAKAERQARYRIFGSKPGSYGAGLLPLIDERNWHDDADIAETYVNWGGYAYTGSDQGVDARPVFRRRLESVQVAVHNQDNREHDIFDSDDYFQFHGGMIASIRALTGKKPAHYFGDTHDPSRPAVRDLKEEVLRVFRTRVVNPKWLESITRHGYKGGLELAATVDYLFGYDATAGVVDDWMYEQVARSYALDPAMRDFFARSSPWALQGISERLLEAAERGLWAEPSPDVIASLQACFLESETMLESRQEITATDTRRH